MKYFLPLIALLLALTLAACDSGVTPDTAVPEVTLQPLEAPASNLQGLSKDHKDRVCHVGNEVLTEGAYAGLTYKEAVIDGNCDPATETCPDAGKIDLIEVARVEKHIDNEDHCYDGKCDWTPLVLGDDPKGDEDEDGEDNACETGDCPSPEDVPCATISTYDRETDVWEVYSDVIDLFSSLVSCGGIPEIEDTCRTVCGDDYELAQDYLVGLEGPVGLYCLDFEDPF